MNTYIYIYAYTHIHIYIYIYMFSRPHLVVEDHQRLVAVDWHEAPEAYGTILDIIVCMLLTYMCIHI